MEQSEELLTVELAAVAGNLQWDKVLRHGLYDVYVAMSPMPVVQKVGFLRAVLLVQTLAYFPKEVSVLYHVSRGAQLYVLDTRQAFAKCAVDSNPELLVVFRMVDGSVFAGP